MNIKYAMVKLKPFNIQLQADTNALVSVNSLRSSDAYMRQ